MRKHKRNVQHASAQLTISLALSLTLSLSLPLAFAISVCLFIAASLRSAYMDHCVCLCAHIFRKEKKRNNKRQKNNNRSSVSITFDLEYLSFFFPFILFSRSLSSFSRSNSFCFSSSFAFCLCAHRARIFCANAALVFFIFIVHVWFGSFCAPYYDIWMCVCVWRQFFFCPSCTSPPQCGAAAAVCCLKIYCRRGMVYFKTYYNNQRASILECTDDEQFHSVASSRFFSS